MRSSIEVTESEKAAFIAFAKEHGIILEGADGEANGKLIRANFVEGNPPNWNEDITKESLAKYLEALRPHLKFYSENQKAVLDVWAELSPAERQCIEKYWSVDRQILGNEYNYAVLLKYLRGRSLQVTDANIARAVEQCIDLLQWRHTSTFKSRVSQEEKDAHTTPGRFIERANMSPADHKKENDDALAKARGDKTSMQQREINAAQVEAEGLTGRTHYETQEIRKPLVADAKGNIDWQSTLRLRRLVQQGFDKARMTRVVQR